ncbi:MAG: GNAT family N-acetyltransferase [Caryophanon sp.]|nr:GNAT family N-acetyltransferase [Caryophanon sp.]
MKAIEITTMKELQQAFSLRQDVFVEEQGVPAEAELDAFDTLHEGTTHILVLNGDEAIGTGRFRLKNGVGKVERVCVAKSARGQGVGNIIMEKIEQLARGKQYDTLTLHAQTHAKPFYEKLGYVATSEEFMEENIPHVVMTKELA